MRKVPGLYGVSLILSAVPAPCLSVELRQWTSHVIDASPHSKYYADPHRQRKQLATSFSFMVCRLLRVFVFAFRTPSTMCRPCGHVRRWISYCLSLFLCGPALQSLAIEAFARALRQIPTIILENGGTSSGQKQAPRCMPLLFSSFQTSGGRRPGLFQCGCWCHLRSLTFGVCCCKLSPDTLLWRTTLV